MGFESGRRLHWAGHTAAAEIVSLSGSFASQGNRNAWEVVRFEGGLTHHIWAAGESRQPGDAGSLPSPGRT